MESLFEPEPDWVGTKQPESVAADPTRGYALNQNRPFPSAPFIRKHV